MNDKENDNPSDDELPASKPTFADAMDDLKKRTRSIYSVNGKFRSQLVECKDDSGWICQIWTYTAEGGQRPVLRNVQPFATMEEAIQMAQRCFAQLTGDDRYFAEEDIRKENEPK